MQDHRKLLLDSSAFVYFLGGVEPYFSALQPVFQRVMDGRLSIVASVVTEAELLVQPERTGDRLAVERIGDLLSEDGIYEGPVDRRIARRAAVLRARTRPQA